MVQLLAKNNGSYINIDLDENLVIALNKSIEDITDIRKRKSGYSKTFEIPGTDNNQKFFRNVFDVNATDFDKTLKTDCVIQNGGDIFNGTLRLNKISVTPNGNFYEVFIIEEIGDFSAELQNFRICDLDFEEIEHIVNADNILQTWNYTGGTYNNFSGIVGKIMYPLAHTGYDPNFTFGRWDYGPSGFTNINHPLTIDQFKPWINVRFLVDKMFEKIGYTFESNFFDSEFFLNQFVLAGQNAGMGTAIVGGRPSSQNFFEMVYEGVPYFYLFDESNPWEFFIYNTEVYDYLGIFDKSPFPQSGGGENWFRPLVSGLYQVNIRQSINIANSAFAPTYIDVVLRDIDSGQLIDIISGLVIRTGNVTNLNLRMGGVLTKGRRYAIQFRRQLNVGQPANTLRFTQSPDASIRLFNSPNLVLELGDILWEGNLPCSLTLRNFFLGLVNMFNLVVIPKGDKKILIEPWNNYLNFQEGKTYDWSDKLDYNQSYEIEPADFSLKKLIDFTYRESNDVLSQFYIDEFNRVFGDKQFLSNNPLLEGELKIELPFEPLPTDAITTGSTMVIPQLYQVSDGDIREKPMSNGMKIGFFTGLVPHYTGATDTVATPFYVLADAITFPLTAYTAMNHLSILTESFAFDISDLNFDHTWDFFEQFNNFRSFTPNTLYNVFYKQYIEALYSDETRIVTANFILTPEEIAEIDFNDKFIFLNSIWRLYNIKDADITQKSSVECTFIKIPFEASPIDPPPPNYVNQRQERDITPTPEPIILTVMGKSVINDTNSSDACNNYDNDRLYTVLNQVEGLQIGDIVYDDFEFNVKTNGNNNWVALADVNNQTVRRPVQINTVGEIIGIDGLCP